MKIVPENDYIHIETINEEESSGNFQWTKQAADLTAVKVISGQPRFSAGEKLIVISTMIQEFEYKKNKFKVCPASAVVAALLEE